MTRKITNSRITAFATGVTAIVAVITLICVYFYPINYFFQKAHITVDGKEELLIYINSAGKISVSQELYLENTGLKPEDISIIALIAYRDKKGSLDVMGTFTDIYWKENDRFERNRGTLRIFAEHMWRDKFWLYQDRQTEKPLKFLDVGTYEYIVAYKTAMDGKINCIMYGEFIINSDDREKLQNGEDIIVLLRLSNDLPRKKDLLSYLKQI